MPLTVSERATNLRFIAAAAVAAEKASGIPAELSCAQCILESGWLESAPGNNPFGIKVYQGAPGRQLLDTTEWFTHEELNHFLQLGDSRTATVFLRGGVPQTSGARTLYRVKDWFAAFPALSDAFGRHAEMMLTVAAYQDATKQYQASGNLSVYVETIAKKYATSPVYATQVEQLIAQDNVKTALKTARQGFGTAGAGSQ